VVRWGPSEIRGGTQPTGGRLKQPAARRLHRLGTHASLYRGLEERLRSRRGVRAAAIASDLQLEPDSDRRAWAAEHPTRPAGKRAVAVTWVQGDFFGSYGIPLITGRHFSDDEQRDTATSRSSVNDSPTPTGRGKRGRQASQVGSERVIPRTVAHRHRCRRRCC
jgi:hypothetical protein